jgi:glycosyltransferase involved in cell wall biosynthesis
VVSGKRRDREGDTGSEVRPSEDFNPLDHPTIFKKPARLVEPFSWVGHIPFVMFLVPILRPRVLVELGTHSGNSYCAMCQSVQQSHMDTRCYAIDTWQGDAQAGFYGPEVLDDLRTYHDQRYAGFSRLIQSTFDDALQDFGDATIDLLHIDGCHTYEAVSHDLECWLPKVSENGVVLLHDINVREGDFGVWRLWTELCDRYPHFELTHSHGLGLIALSDDQPDLLRQLLNSGGERAADARRFFAGLGENVTAEAVEAESSRGRLWELEQRLSQHRERLTSLERTLESASIRIAEQHEALTARDWRIAALQEAVTAGDGWIEAQHEALTARDGQIEELHEALTVRDGHIAALLNSLSWRLTAPLRRLGWLRSAPLLGLLKWLYWSASLQLPYRLRQRRDIQLIKASGLFDVDFYLDRYHDAAASGSDPVYHFVECSISERRNPNPFFDTGYYLDQYPDVAASGLNPLIHYLQTGAAQGYNPSPRFDTRHYLDQNPEVVGSGVNPLRHYLQTGANEGYSSKSSGQGSHSPGDPSAVAGAATDCGAPPAEPVGVLCIDETHICCVADYLRPTPLPWLAESASWPTAEASGDTEDLSRLAAPPKMTVALSLGKVPAHFLRAAIDSVLKQDFRPWEIQLLVEPNGPWHAATLRSSWSLNVPQMTVQEDDSRGDAVAILEALARTSSGDFIILLNPYDELLPRALSAVARELQLSDTMDVLLSEEDPAGETLWAPEEYLNSALPEVGFDKGLSFGQLLAVRRTALTGLTAAPVTATEHRGRWLSERLTEVWQQGRLRWVKGPLYFRRPVPGSASLVLGRTGQQSSSLAPRVVSTPLQLTIDARLPHRNRPRTERYLQELMLSLSQLSQRHDIRITALGQAIPEADLQGVRFVSESWIDTIRNAHVFHKPIQPHSNQDLVEMGQAAVCVFTPIDLIAYAYADLFQNESQHFQYCRLMETAARVSDMLLGISNYNREDLIRWLHLPHEKVASVYLGVRPDSFLPPAGVESVRLKSLGVPRDYLLSIGTDYPHKNLLRLLQAFSKVKEELEGAALVLVGERYHGRPQPAFDSLLKRSAPRVLHLGHVSDEDLRVLYHNARALVYPSLHEGSGLPVLEAMLCCVPVIASNAAGIPELTGQNAALLFDGRDVDALGGAMVKIWHDAALRQQLAAAGTLRADKFSWEATAEGTLRCCRRALHQALAQDPTARSIEKARDIQGFVHSPPTVLIVSHVRFHSPEAGIEIRLNRFIKYLKMIGYRIVVLVNPFRENAALNRGVRRGVYRFADYYEEIGEALGHAATDVALRIGGLPQAEPILARWQEMEDRFCSPAVLERTKAIIDEFQPSIIMAESIWMSRVLELAPTGTLRVIDLIDELADKSETEIRYGIEDSLAVTPEEQRAFLDRADVAIAMQESEAETLRKLRPKCRMVTAGVDFEAQVGAVSATGAGAKPQILIVASDNALSVRCVREFLDEVWPVLVQKIADCSLRIVGKVCGSLEVRQNNVELSQHVARIEEAYERATVVVNPLYAGTGLGIKSIEGLGYGKVLVSWPEGVAGMPAWATTPYLVCQSWGEMAQKIIHMVDDAEKRRALEFEARAYAAATLRADAVYGEVTQVFDAHSQRKDQWRILCLYLRHGLDEHAEGLDELRGWYAANISRGSVTIWIIDNKLPTGFDGHDWSGCRLLGGDNRCWEFSGWQRTLGAYAPELREFDVVHFVTSAFGKLHAGYLNHFSEDQLDMVVHRPVCLGHVDSYDEPVELCGRKSRSWIRTSFFFLSRESLSKLGSLVSLDDPDLFFGLYGMFKRNSPISDNYKDKITQWLGGDAVQGVAWHGSIDRIDRFKTKAFAILNEHMLSIRLREAGVQLVDLQWLEQQLMISNDMAAISIPPCGTQVGIRPSELASSSVVALPAF